MIIAASIFIFLALFSIGLGVHLVGVADRREMIRRRLLEAEDLATALDPSILRVQRMSSIGIVNRLLTGLRFARRLEALLVQASVSLKVSVFIMLSIFIGLLGGMLVHLLSHHLALSALGGFCAACVPVMLVLAKKDRRTRAFDEEFPDAIDMMVNSLRAGFAFTGAIQMVAEEAPDPVSSEFRVLYEEQQLGLDIRYALMNLAERVDSTDVALFVTAVLIQRDTGGNLAEVLEKLAFVIRDRFRILGEVRTFTAQGRLSGLILALLPLIVAFAMTILSPGYMEILLENDAGTILINVAVALQLLGFFAIRKIINIKI